MKIFFLVLFISVLGFAKNPDSLVISFQKQKNPEQLKKATETVKIFLEKKLGQKIEVVVPTSYGATVQGLISKKVDIAYMDSLPFILASAEIDLEIIAVEKRNNKTSYDSLIVVHKDSPIKSVHELNGRKIAFSSQTSTSGFLFPTSYLVSEKLITNSKDLKNYFSQIVYAGGYDKALLAVANRQVDAAAFSDYAFEGPKADLYGDLTTRNQIKIIARISGVPTHLIAASKKLSPEMIKKIQSALFELSKENSELFSSVYGASALTNPDPNHVEKTKKALKDTGLNVKEFVK